MLPSAPALLTRLPRWLPGRAPPGLRGATLLLDLGWMDDFLARGVVWRGLAAGWRIVPVRPLFARRQVLETTAAAPGSVDWEETRAGIALRDVCLYDICVRSDISVAALEAGDPARHAATSFALARPLVDEIARLLDAYRPARVVYPQGHVLPAAILRRLAEARGIPCLAIENCFRSDRFVWDDRTGTTLASPIPRMLHAARPDRPGAEVHFAAYRRRIAELKSAEHRNAGAADLPRAGGRRILLIGQVATDSSVLFHLGAGFRDQMAVFDTVLAHAAATPGDTVLVKTHPKEAGGLSPAFTRYSTERYVRFAERVAAAGCAGRVHLDTTGAIDILEAIDWADLCVTINSQAGLEAAAAGRPLLLCGAASYDHLASVTRTTTPAALAAALAGPTPPAAPQEARAFFECFCEDYARPRSIAALARLVAERPVAPPLAEAGRPALASERLDGS